MRENTLMMPGTACGRKERRIQPLNELKYALVLKDHIIESEEQILKYILVLLDGRIR